ncbi:MAG: DUF6262 family protein [Streptosporangiaceae bacterium]
MTTPARTAAANETRRRSTQAKLQRVQDTLTRMRRDKTPVTFPAVARHAQVSRTFLYDNHDARHLMDTAATRAPARQDGHARHDSPAETSWRERALNTEDALKAAHQEIRTQRDRIGHLLGQIRDTEHESPAATLQRITTENTTLKQRVHGLAQQNRTLEEHLQAARSNVRFADRRIAQLEAQLTEPQQQARRTIE